jgi:hypothetical protein
MRLAVPLLGIAAFVWSAALVHADEYDGHPYRYSRPLTYYDRQPFTPNLNYDGYPPRRTPRVYQYSLVPRRDDHFDYFDLDRTRLEQRPYHRIRPPYYPSAYLYYRDQPHYGAFNHSGYP